jgi:hypothetical protein
MADTVGGVVERLRRAGKVMCAGQADQAIAEILPLEQHEDDEDD